MTEYFIELFTQTCIALIPLIPAVLAIWLIIDLICGLFFREK